jgi:rhodanese-related sulfurtransferase
MKNLLFCLVYLFLVPIAAAQSSKKFNTVVQALYKHSVPQINAQQLSRDLQRTTNMMLLDTRETAEYQVSHIATARCVGYDNFDKKSIENLPKDTKIVVYCSVGYRSERIGEILQQMGFTKVYNLYGGIFDWVNQKNTVVDASEKPVQKIHAYNRLWGKLLNGNCEKVLNK